MLCPCPPAPHSHLSMEGEVHRFDACVAVVQAAVPTFQTQGMNICISSEFLGSAAPTLGEFLVRGYKVGCYFECVCRCLRINHYVDNI